MSARQLGPAQRRRVERARAVAAAMGPAAVAAEVEAQTGCVPYDSGDPYPEAFGLAAVRLGDLLDIIDELTGGQS
jgi:hypothetical protein